MRCSSTVPLVFCLMVLGMSTGSGRCAEQQEGADSGELPPNRYEVEIDLLAGKSESERLSVWRVFNEKPDDANRTWRVTEEGVLRCTGTPRGYLATKRDYGDFVLRLQWRWPEGKEGKGGVLINVSGPDCIWPKSLEAQINAGGAGDFWALGGFVLHGPADRLKTIDHPQFGKLTHLARTADMELPPGRWNQYEIVAERETVILKINGREVNRGDRGSAAPGPIVLTAEGTPIEFREIRLSVRAADSQR